MGGGWRWLPAFLTVGRTSPRYRWHGAWQVPVEGKGTGSNAQCHRPGVVPFSVASGLCCPQELGVKPVLLKCSVAWDCGRLNGSEQQPSGGPPGDEGGGWTPSACTPCLPPLCWAGSSPFCPPCSAQRAGATQHRPRGDRGDTATTGKRAKPWAGWAALCQQRWQHVAAEQVPIRLRRINLYFPRFRGAGGAVGARCPPPSSSCAPATPCQRLYNLPSILIRFSTSPSPAHSSPNAEAGRSHDMLSNQLLNSDFSWLSLEEASHSLCLVLPEQGAALRFTSTPWRWAMPVPRGASGHTRREPGDPTKTQRCAELGTCKSITSTHRPATRGRVGANAGTGRSWGCRVARWCCAGDADCSPPAHSVMAAAAAVFPGLILCCSCRAGRLVRELGTVPHVPVLAQLRCGRCIAGFGSFPGTRTSSAASCGSARSQGMQTLPSAAKPQLIACESRCRWKSRCLWRGCQRSVFHQGSVWP